MRIVLVCLSMLLCRQMRHHEIHHQKFNYNELVSSGNNDMIQLDSTSVVLLIPTTCTIFVCFIQAIWLFLKLHHIVGYNNIPSVGLWYHNLYCFIFDSFFRLKTSVTIKKKTFSQKYNINQLNILHLTLPRTKSVLTPENCS